MSDLAVEPLAVRPPAPGDPEDPRWLARRVLAAGSVPALSELPAPRPVSRALRRDSPARSRVHEYLRWWIDHADDQGAFARRLRWLRWLPSAVLLRLLTALDYDGLLYQDSTGVLGHVFYQRHGEALHGFSVGVGERPSRHGLGAVMLLDYIAVASAMPGVASARIGRGANATTRRILQRLRAREAELGWRVSEDGWVRFRGATST